MPPHLTDEILHLICSLSWPQTLIALAQTSKQVSEVAVKYRWNYIESVECLHYAFSSEAYTLSENGNKRVISLTRDLTPSEVERVRKYAAFVGTISVTDWDNAYVTFHPQFDKAAWEIFLKHFGPRDFPRLHTIRSDQGIGTEEDYISPLHRIMSNPLRNIQLKVNYLLENGARYDNGQAVVIEQESRHRRNIITRILPNLASNPFDIHNLDISTNAFLPDLLEGLSTAISQLHHLSTCILSGPLFIQPHALKRLASLPSLRKLHLAIRQADYKDGLESYISDLDCSFRALQDLVLHVDESRYCVVDFIRSVRSRQLQRFEITIEDYVSGDSIVALLSTLATHPSAPSLTRLTLNLGRPHPGLESSEAAQHKLLESSSFSHLSSFPALEVIRISGKSFGGVDNETLQAVAYNCPNIQALHAYPGWKERIDWAHVSLATLETFFQRCRRLLMLHLHLGISGVEIQSALKRAETNPFHDFHLRTHSAFEILDVGRSSIRCESHVYPLAVLLSLWAPQVRHICYDWKEGDQNWSQVRSLLRPLTLVRKQERQ